MLTSIISHSLLSTTQALEIKAEIV